MAPDSPGGCKADIMAKAPKPGDEIIEDAELLASVDASGKDNPTVLPEPDRPEPLASDFSPEEAANEPVQTANPTKDSAPRRDTPTPQPPTQSGFLPLVLGGALVAMGGFAASHFNLLNLTTPGANTALLEQKVTEQAALIATLQEEVNRLATTPAPDAGLSDKLATLEADLATLRAAPAPEAVVDLAPLTNRLQELESQMAALAAMPAGDGTGVAPAALAALQAEVTALKSAGGAQSEEVTRLAAEAEARIAEAEARAAALADSIAASAKAAAARAALGRLQAALESGAPYGTALTDLGAAEIPAVLQEAATSGLPTLADLEDSFPAAARSALEAALRANMGESWTERVSAFLRTQTGARSLSPREGSDPDAILSRAEAALAAGDVTASVAEIRTLPEAGLAAMTNWLAVAERRIAAEVAVADLVSRLGN
jgi:hypothetical protein